MKTITVRGKTIGNGRPKTIVPIVAHSAQDILNQAVLLQKQPLDFIEWRADFFEEVEQPSERTAFFAELRAALSDTPLLITYRRAVEGGEGTADLAAYTAFCSDVIASGCADLLDIELSAGSEAILPLLKAAHEQGLPVILSNHNFTKTPSVKEMVETLRNMQSLGGDIAKLAVMPTSTTDLLHLLTATNEMSTLYPETPIITMSMGALGQPSRICGGSFGSAMTFASIGDVSAPGQIALPEMNQMLNLLYGTNE